MIVFLLHGLLIPDRFYSRVVHWLLSHLSPSAEAVSTAVEKYADMVRRICFLQLRNRADVEDVFQEVFLKYFLHAHILQDEKHEKAWLCRVAYNKCKDMNKSAWSRKRVSLENLEIPFENEEERDLIIVVLNLPPADKQVIYLHYYEGWTIPEIAVITGQKLNTVYSQLRRAKAKLKKELGEPLD